MIVYDRGSGAKELLDDDVNVPRATNKSPSSIPPIPERLPLTAACSMTLP